METPWVIIPTYNEKDNIERMISSIFALEISGLQLLIVDDSSPDGTANVVQELQTQYPQLHLEIRSQKSGLGPAYIHGFKTALHAGATAIIQMDADFSHDPADIPRLLNELKESDVVIGSRYKNGISVINWPLRRLILSLGGNSYARVITGIPIQDITGGFRAWKAAALKDIDLSAIHADGYGFQIVMAYRAWKQQQKIIEIPIIFTERREGQSKMSNAIVREALLLPWRLRLLGK